MRRQAPVQVAQSAEPTVGKWLSRVVEVFGRDAHRNVVAWALDLFPESYRNLLDLFGIGPIGLWYDPDVSEQSEDGVWARQRRAHAPLQSLCKPLREGIT